MSDQISRVVIRDQEVVNRIRTLLDQSEMDPMEFQTEQENILSSLERHGGSARLEEIATDMFVDVHELAVPIDLLHQEDVLTAESTERGIYVYLPGQEPDLLED